jgi:hypothetical protein
VLFTAQRLASEPTNYAANQFRVVLDATAGTATTDCTTNPRLLRVNPGTTGADMQYIAAHELGHAYGLRHSGIDDNLTSGNSVHDSGPAGPLMSGCVRPPGVVAPRTDDLASVSHKASNSNMTPNGGFEWASLDMFAKTGTVAFDSTYRFSGTRSARIDGVGSITQRVRMTTPVATEVFRTRYKTNSTTSKFKAQVRSVAQTEDATCPMSPTGFGSWSYAINATLGSATSWTYKNATFSLSAVTVDAEITMLNNTPGVSVWVDDMGTVI